MVKLNVKKLLKEKNKTKYWLFNMLNNVGNISYTNFNNLVENKTGSIKYSNILQSFSIILLHFSFGFLLAFTLLFNNYYLFYY